MIGREKPVNRKKRIARVRKRPVPKKKAGFTNVSFLGQKVLANKAVVSEIARLVRASYRHGVEAVTTFYGHDRRLCLSGISLKKGFEGSVGSKITPIKQLGVFSPENFNLSIHTHPKFIRGEASAHEFSQPDLKVGHKGEISLIIVLPFYPPKPSEKHITLNFMFARFPKTFDANAYAGRVFQETQGGERKESPELQRRIFREMGAKFFSFDLKCNRRFDNIGFDQKIRKRIIAGLS